MKRAFLNLLLFSMATGSIFGEDPAPGRQVEQSIDFEGGGSMGYLLWLPNDYGKEEGRRWPVVLFLHGRGESYGPLSLVAKWGPPQMAARGDDLPYIIVSPQCPRESDWRREDQQKGVMTLLEDILEKYSGDADRVYLTGLSMGGYGSWRLAADHPDRFAAVIPICGGGNPEDGEKLVRVPIWVFHGTEDSAVPLRLSEEMVEAVRRAGGDRIRFTVLEHIGHNSWSAAYATPELYQWMEAQTRAESAGEGAE
ncbi:MAG TPA: alpha/beta hydrolase-fold protein [Verrucomicrobiales bacterium]|nr:alpha/beta hydrolase-fold protein [Verrucomicrobiales bacterium]